jgi:anti-anti-sigma factor
MTSIGLSGSRLATSGLAVVCSQDKYTVEFSLHGELNLGNAQHLEHAVTRTMRARLERIVIQIAPLAFADLVGVRALLAISERCGADQTELAFRGIASPQVMKILALVGADKRLGLASAD